jgi:hypothetical protein
MNKKKWPSVKCFVLVLCLWLKFIFIGCKIFMSTVLLKPIMSTYKVWFVMNGQWGVRLIMINNSTFFVALSKGAEAKSFKKGVIRSWVYTYASSMTVWSLCVWLKLCASVCIDQQPLVGGSECKHMAWHIVHTHWWYQVIRIPAYVHNLSSWAWIFHCVSILIRISQRIVEGQDAR